MSYRIRLMEHDVSPLVDGLKGRILKIPTEVRVDRNNKTAVAIEDAIGRSQRGRIPYSEFMRLSLYGEGGYYSSGNVEIGLHKDFITCPESTEFFGATIGKTVLKAWLAMESPERFDIVEMGAGNGTMAKDILAWARQYQPKFYEAIRYVIIERGDLIQRQKDTIGGKARADRHVSDETSTSEDHRDDLSKVHWVTGSALDLPLGDGSIQGAIVSNELPDAFPVEVVRKIGNKIFQKYVTIENNKWVEVWAEPSDEVKDYLAANNYDKGLSEGNEEAVNLNAVRWQKQLDRVLKRGVIITIDYGQMGLQSSVGEGEPAIRTYGKTGKSRSYEEYTHPGYFDITADVDFKPLEAVATADGFRVAFSGKQREFLSRSDFGGFAEPVFRAIREERSWDRIVFLAKKLYGYRRVLFDYETDFYAQVLSKGLGDSFSIDDPAASPVYDTRIELLIGKPNTRYKIEFNSREPNGWRHPYVVKTDERGVISLDACRLLPFDPDYTKISAVKRRFFRRFSEILEQRRNRLTLKRSITQAGYDLHDKHTRVVYSRVKA